MAEDLTRILCAASCVATHTLSLERAPLGRHRSFSPLLMAGGRRESSGNPPPPPWTEVSPYVAHPGSSPHSLDPLVQQQHRPSLLRLQIGRSPPRPSSAAPSLRSSPPDSHVECPRPRERFAPIPSCSARSDCRLGHRRWGTLAVCRLLSRLPRFCRRVGALSFSSSPVSATLRSALSLRVCGGGSACRIGGRAARRWWYVSASASASASWMMLGWRSGLSLRLCRGGCGRIRWPW